MCHSCRRWCCISQLRGYRHQLSHFSGNSQIHVDCPRSFAGVGSAILAVDGTTLVLAASEVTGNDAWSSGAVYTASIFAGLDEVAAAAASVTVHNTVFHDNHADGHVEVVTGNSQYVAITNNTFYEGGRGVFANAAVAILGGPDAGTADVRNNTFHDYEIGLFVSGSATATASNNIFSHNDTGLSASADSNSTYNFFDSNGQDYDGGIQPGTGDQQGDAGFPNPAGGNFQVDASVPLGDPSLDDRNWDGTTNRRGFQGGTPHESMQPDEISINLQRLATRAFVSALSPAPDRPELFPAPAVDSLDFNQVNSITAIPLVDDGGNYIVARPRAGVDNHMLPVFSFDPASGHFVQRKYDEAAFDYTAVGIDPDTLPPAAKYFSRVNFGDFDPTTGGFPLYYTIGGDDGYGRANAAGQVAGVSDRVAGAQGAFSQGEDFPYLTAVFVTTNPQGGATLLARFESQHTTGAFQLDIKGGRPTVVDAEGLYFTREAISAGSDWGFKAFSSMHWRRPDETPAITNDSAFDTQFVQVVFADGSSEVHELRNPEVLNQLDIFDLGAATGATVEQFSLVQPLRDRSSFDLYDSARYDLRPTVVTAILEQNIPTTIKVLHDQGSSEFLDNLVVLLSPRQDIPATATLSDAVHLRTRSLYGEMVPDQPPLIAADVNADGVVDVVDAVLVINTLLLDGVRELTFPVISKPFFDVDRNLRVDVVDALRVIHYLLTPPEPSAAVSRVAQAAPLLAVAQEETSPDWTDLFFAIEADTHGTKGAKAHDQVFASLEGPI